jgi:predicted MPP superfamily phosphohydrolase
VFANIHNVLNKAPENLFSIILVHDPFYWSEGLFDEFPLTLSGHTHGGQFGFFINKQLSLSLASINGKTGGLYTNESNNLIINTGLGHVGVNFHLGFSSQIAVIKLHKK